MSSAASPGSAEEALGMLRSAMGYLAAADATAMAAETQAQCLQALEQVNSMGTAARASILAAFTSGQGYSADADYSPRAWLIHKTQITKGAAVAYTAWARRAAAHPLVAQRWRRGRSRSRSPGRSALDGQAPGGVPAGRGRDPGLARPGPGWTCGTWPGWPGRSTPGPGPTTPDDGPETAFEDRSVKLETTFDGAGVLHGDLTPECAAIVGTVLDALSAPAGAEDTRSQAQRYHDALHEAMQRLVTAGLLPERAGQPVKAWAHISLADLMLLDGSSALLEEWTARVRAQWAGHRAEASAGGGDGGAWLDGDAAAAMACDAAMAPFVTGEVNPAALDDLVRLCVAAGPAPPPPRSSDRRPTAGRTRPPPTPPGPGRPSSKPSSAKPWICCPGRAGWRRSCAAGSSAPGWAGPACRWTSATPRRSRPGSATRSSCGISTASGPAGATSPPRRAEVHHVKHKANGGKTSVRDCVLLCWFHHQVVIHRWGWTLVLNPDGTTTAWNPDKTKVLHSHSPPVRPG